MITLMYCLASFGIAVIVVLAFYVFVFKRDPTRIIPAKGIVSPTDGKVVDITYSKTATKTVPKGLIGKIHTKCKDVSKECILISIMMTPLNVHFQRAPIAGKVMFTKHYSGKFKNAVSTQNLSILENEHNEILIKGKKYKMKVIQIAGFLARRINCYVQEKQVLKKGQKIGFIDLGSQVTLIVPASVKLSIKLGDNLKGGETIIGN